MLCCNSKLNSVIHVTTMVWINTSAKHRLVLCSKQYSEKQRLTAQRNLQFISFPL